MNESYKGSKDPEFHWDAETATEDLVDALDKYMKQNTNRKYRNPYAWIGATNREE